MSETETVLAVLVKVLRTNEQTVIASKYKVPESHTNLNEGFQRQFLFCTIVFSSKNVMTVNDLCH
jgi:hypothetical protein